MQLNIITITKDDFGGVTKTLESTKELREKYGVVQIIVDSSVLANRVALKQFIRPEKNVKYYRCKVKGISKAFNYGVKKSDQEWLWFLNGGDTVFEKVNFDLINDVLNEVKSDLLIFEIIREGGIIKHPSISKMWPPLGWVPHPAAIIKRSCLEEVGCFDVKYKIVMDGDLWIKIFSKKYIVDLISIPLTRFAPGGVSSNAYKTSKEIALLIWNNKKLLFLYWIKDVFEVCFKWFIYTIKNR